MWKKARDRGTFTLFLVFSYTLRTIYNNVFHLISCLNKVIAFILLYRIVSFSRTSNSMLRYLFFCQNIKFSPQPMGAKMKQSWKH